MVKTISPSSSELVFETAVVRLAAQSADVNALDGKVGVAIAADGVLAGFMFGARSVPGGAWAVIATAALLVLSAVAALLALWPRR